MKSLGLALSVKNKKRASGAHFQDAARYELGLGHEVVIGRRDGSQAARKPAARIGTEVDHRLRVHADAHALRIGVRGLVFPVHLLEERLGPSRFFWTRDFSTRRSR